MKRACVFFFTLLGIFLFTGCPSNNKGRIEGTAWRSLAIVDEDGDEVPAGETEIEFTKGGTVYLRAPEGKYQGEYSLASGDWVTLHLDRELYGKKTHKQRVVIKGNRMTMFGRHGVSKTFEEVH